MENAKFPDKNIFSYVRRLLTFEGSFMQRLCFFGFICFFCFLSLLQSESTPVSYQGRIRPVEAYARLWLYDFYHAQELIDHDLSSTDLIWELHAHGYTYFRSFPLFYIKSQELKKLAKLDPHLTRFSYDKLYRIVYEDYTMSSAILHPFITYHALKAYGQSINHQARRVELSNIVPGLWIAREGSTLTLDTIPKAAPWNNLSVGTILTTVSQPNIDHKSIHQFKQIAEAVESLLLNIQQFKKLEGGESSQELAFQSEYHALKNKRLSSKHIVEQLENNYPLQERLRSAGQLLKVLPSRYPSGEWFSLHALDAKVYQASSDRLVDVSNFTLFPDEIFQQLRQLHGDWKRAMHKDVNSDRAIALRNELTTVLTQAYDRLAVASDRFPSHQQLKTETIYYQYPMVKIGVLLYGITILLFLFSIKYTGLNRFAFLSLGVAFLFHTLILLARCYILNRPPVSNMFETVMYVPWVSVLIGIIFRLIYPYNWIVIASSVISFILLILIEVTGMNSSLENVQPVLNSQFWLMIHVLMVVGSYGVFLLSGLLGHFYLGSLIYHRRETSRMESISRLILQTMYLGTALLIAGTILGGVWAAESWGRFWDWDPKESWAFISICTYIIWIHAYQFHKIGRFGLALGSIIGFLSISFTWYGVNYILGTGLHSYGFGFEGQEYYYAFLALEVLFLAYASSPLVYRRG